MRYLHFGCCISSQETIRTELCVMRLQRSSFIVAKMLLWVAMILVCPAIATAQHHGGHGVGGSTPGGPGRPDGVDEKDTLKDFHHALAVQATSQQIAEFQTLVKNAEAAKTELQQFQQRSQERDAAESARDAALDQALEKARSETQKFIGGFSDAQKSGLKEIAKRLGKADSDLEQEEKKLDQSLQLANVAGSEVASHAESLDKALSDFANQQLALGREMGITLATGQDLTFTLPSVNSPASTHSSWIWSRTCRTCNRTLPNSCGANSTGQIVAGSGSPSGRRYSRRRRRLPLCLCSCTWNAGPALRCLVECRRTNWQKATAPLRSD